jgi:hypothetical protein
MNNFQPGAGLEGAERPLGFFEDQGVQLYRDAAGIEAEGLQKLQHGEAVGDLAGFAIQYNPHMMTPVSGG